MIHCVVPRELSAELHNLLREHFRGDPSVDVVLEMRRAGRRRPGDRRRDKESGPPGDERRRIRATDGRRIADRRAPMTSAAPPPLPPEAEPFADMLLFLEREEPSDQAELDADTKRLVTAFQSGETDVFDEIYLRHYGSVYGYAHAATRSGQDADDVAQEVFMRALEALPGYEIRSTPFRAWLFRIAQNVVLDALRKSKRLVVEDPHELTSRTDALAHENHAELDWVSKRDVANRIDRLPRPHREVIVLRYLLDLPYDEIAGLTDQTPRAARHLHTRAIRLLNQ